MEGIGCVFCVLSFRMPFRKSSVTKRPAPKDPAPRPAKKERFPSARMFSAGVSGNRGKIFSQPGITGVAYSGTLTIPSALVEEIV